MLMKKVNSEKLKIETIDPDKCSTFNQKFFPQESQHQNIIKFYYFCCHSFHCEYLFSLNLNLDNMASDIQLAVRWR